MPAVMRELSLPFPINVQILLLEHCLILTLIHVLWMHLLTESGTHILQMRPGVSGPLWNVPAVHLDRTFACSPEMIAVHWSVLEIMEDFPVAIPRTPLWLRLVVPTSSLCRQHRTLLESSHTESQLLNSRADERSFLLDLLEEVISKIAHLHRHNLDFSESYMNLVKYAGVRTIDLESS